VVRRKVLQSYANVLCQHFIDLGSGFDVEAFCELGSGHYSLDILTGACTKDGAPIRELRVCRHFRQWLTERLAKDRVPPGVEVALLEVHMTVANVSVRVSYGHRFGAADFTYQCRSEIRTDEKTYVGVQSGGMRWGFMPGETPR
jgi:hypothetical protein